MSRKARSALGQVVDFDYIAIKQQLAAKPVPVSVNQRRKFIDEKDGIKTKETIQVAPSVELTEVISDDSPLAVAKTAAEQSKSAKSKSTK